MCCDRKPSASGFSVVSTSSSGSTSVCRPSANSASMRTLHRLQPQLLETAGLGLQLRHPGHVGIRVAPPQRQDLAEQFGRLCRLGVGDGCAPAPPRPRTAASRCGPDRPSGGSRRPRTRRRRPTRCGSGRCDSAVWLGPPGGGSSPQTASISSSGDVGSTGVCDQDGENGALLGPLQLDRVSLSEHPHRPQDAEVHRGMIGSSSPVIPPGRSAHFRC